MGGSLSRTSLSRGIIAFIMDEPAWSTSLAWLGWAGLGVDGMGWDRMDWIGLD